MSHTAIQRGDGEMEYRILGPIEVRSGDRVLTPAAARQRALLGVLLLHTGEAVPAGVLVDAMWGGAAPRRPATALRAQVDGLREALDPGRAPGAPSILVADGAGVRLWADPDTVDLCRFERLTAEARGLAGADPVRASALLREACSLWSGPALTGAGLAGAAHGEAARLNRLRVEAIADRVQADLEMGRHAALVPELEALVAAHPQSERLLALLMLALHRSGRHETALATGANARLRLEPGPELESLERAIRDRDPELDGPATRSSLTVVGMPAAAGPAPDQEHEEEEGDADGDAPSPSPATPAVRRRRSPVALAGAAVLVVAGAAGGAGIHHLRASAGQVPAHVSGSFPDAREQAIVRQLGPAVTGCHRYADHYALALAEVECGVRPDHPGGSAVVVQSFASYNDMEVHFHHVLGLTVQSETGRPVASARRSRCDEPGAEFFALSNYRMSAQGQDPRGHLLCYLDHTGVPRLAWTDIQRLTVSQATGTAGARNTTCSGLLDLWRSLTGGEEITPGGTAPALPVATEAPAPTATLASAVTPPQPLTTATRQDTPPTAPPTPAATARPATTTTTAGAARSGAHGRGSDGWDGLRNLFDPDHDGGSGHEHR